MVPVPVIAPVHIDRPFASHDGLNLVPPELTDPPKPVEPPATVVPPVLAVPPTLVVPPKLVVPPVPIVPPVPVVPPVPIAIWSCATSEPAGTSGVEPWGASGAPTVVSFVPTSEARLSNIVMGPSPPPPSGGVMRLLRQLRSLQHTPGNFWPAVTHVYPDGHSVGP